VIVWDSQALVGEPQRRRRKAASQPPKTIELFKLHLGNAPEEQKTKRPPNFSAEIIVYLNFHSLLKKFNAVGQELISLAMCVWWSLSPPPQTLKEQNLITEASYRVVDCGGGTVDLTVRKLLDDNQIGEATGHSGDFCGSTYVDKEFSTISKISFTVNLPILGHTNYILKKCPALKQYARDQTREKLDEE
ncbi:1454_t:CDS:2, partial [Ambispora gerdemannii]